MAREQIYIEECCFNWIRDSCTGGDCPCRCHVEVPAPMRPESVNAGPQPDEMVRLQQALDATEEEVARLQSVRDAAERKNTRLLSALSDIQFDLINCHQAAGRDACEHIQDAIKIVNRTLAAECVS